MTPEIDNKTYLPISVWFWQYQALSPTIGWMWWWCDKVTIEARTRFQCKLNDALEFMKFIDEHSLFIHHFKSSSIFTFHSSFLKIIHQLHFSSIVNEYIINASNNVSHSNYQYIMVLLPPSPYVVHWDIFDQVVWIIFEDWIYVINVAKYVMQRL